MQPALQTKNISKTYDKTVRALHPLNLEVAPGEVFGLLGPNGAGKTTLVKLILGLVSPTTGSATIAGLPISDPAAREITGYLPENHRFPPFLTADQVLVYFGGLAKVEASELRKRIPELLETVRLEKWRYVRVGKFSKGMLQRLGLAQALLSDPEILFLDEPTDGVDPIGRSEIRALIQELSKNNKTIFLNSHLLSEVEQVCTRVAILNEGKLIGTSTIDELTSRPNIFVFETSQMPRTTSKIVAQDPVLIENLSASVRWKAEFVDTTHMNAFIDHLRNENITILSVTPYRTTLEDRFIELVKCNHAVGVS